ncbi:MAG: ADP-forming succinate--CoA ligase subunit beta [Theionarchaea archaeon]|nr:ADP-forming succinate--CoA ligase subunit beta [Theionarchaea archaeon]
MKLYEYEAKEIFAQHGIPVPEGKVITDPDEIEGVMYPLVLKAQVLVGGRGKAGGVKIVENIGEAKEAAEMMLSMDIKGIPVKKLLVYPAVDIQKEYYLGFVVDRNSRRVVAIASSEGGVDIEEVAEKSPEKIAKLEIDPLLGLKSYHTVELGKQIGLGGKTLLNFSRIALRLYKICEEYDAELVEINPLALSEEGFSAVDAKLNVDDNALYRQKFKPKEEEYTELERMAKKAGLSYVSLDGDIAIIGCGAGLVMASLDLIQKRGGRPANFLDVGGGANAENMKQALEIVTRQKGLKSIFVNIFGGITRCDQIADGIVEFGPEIPLSVRMMGTNEEEGKKILRENGYSVSDSMAEAAQKAVELARA